MALIKITQLKSKIRCIDKHKRTLAALGLRRIRHSIVKQDTPQIRGMIASVAYLVHVAPASESDLKPAPSEHRAATPAVRRAAPAVIKPATKAAAAKKAAPKKPRPKGSKAAPKGGSK
jgi:large subunit ribosomal protein L30